MKRRPLTWDDVAQLRELNARIMQADPARRAMHIGELYWLSALAGDALNGVCVWPRDADGLAAAAWLDPPSAGDFMVAPGSAAELDDDAIAWLEDEAGRGASGTLSIVARDTDATRLEILRRRGYTETGAGDRWLRRSLDRAIGDAPLPQGFKIRHVASEADLNARVGAESAGWGIDPEIARSRWLMLREKLPNYRPELDIVVVAPDGAGIAGCTCWFDPDCGVGEIEAVSAAPAYRRRGIGKAMILDALRRLRDVGAAEAVLYTDIGNVAGNALYRSCGFELVAEDHRWEKTL